MVLLDEKQNVPLLPLIYYLNFLKCSQNGHRPRNFHGYEEWHLFLQYGFFWETDADTELIRLYVTYPDIRTCTNLLRIFGNRYQKRRD